MTAGAKLPSSALSTGAIVLALVAATGGWMLLARPAVVTLHPIRGDAAEVVYATGTVEPKDWAKVVSLQRRRIVEICNCEGKRVKKGDVLARLDDIEERAVLTELEARRGTVKADTERLAILLKRNVTTQVAYDEKVTQLREIDARIAAQKDRLYDLDLRAPMDGMVLRNDGSVGEIAGVGNNDVIFWVGEPKPLEIDAEVNEEDMTASPAIRCSTSSASSATRPDAPSSSSPTISTLPAAPTGNCALSMAALSVIRSRKSGSKPHSCPFAPARS